MQSENLRARQFKGGLEKRGAGFLRLPEKIIT
jgi:hypothetical protein